MNIDAYLQRIGYTGPVVPTLETLRGLHYAHLLTVPFENLSIHLREPIVLDEARLFEKVVARKRGGFCYELNGLFAALLRALGFRLTLHSARVWDEKQQTFGPEFDHLTLLVQLEQLWLVDVGFGDSFWYPLDMTAQTPQPSGLRAYKLTANGDQWLMQEEAQADGSWEGYLFSPRAYTLNDFAERCHEYQTSPECGFTQRLVCSRATPNGRITLSNQRLIHTQGTEKRETPLASATAGLAALREHFAVDLPRWPEVLYPPKEA